MKHVPLTCLLFTEGCLSSFGDHRDVLGQFDARGKAKALRRHLISTPRVAHLCETDHTVQGLRNVVVEGGA